MYTCINETFNKVYHYLCKNWDKGNDKGYKIILYTLLVTTTHSDIFSTGE